MFHCTQVGTIDADLRRNVGSKGGGGGGDEGGGNWYITFVFCRPMVLAASDKRLKMCCRTPVWVRRAHEVISKRQLGDHHLGGFCLLCEETSKVEHAGCHLTGSGCRCRPTCPPLHHEASC